MKILTNLVLSLVVFIIVWMICYISYYMESLWTVHTDFWHTCQWWLRCIIPTGISIGAFIYLSEHK